MRRFLLLVAAMMVAFSSVAQKRTVTGLVTDQSGAPLPGVNIVVKGTTNGTITDFDGKYQLDAKASDVLKFSFLGYIPQEIPASNSVINVKLKEDTKSLDEVVVVGYGTQKKSDITGAVASVSADDLKGQPVSSVDQALQGRVAGVQITSNSGAPGGSISVRVRGIGTINNADPLYVVDGLPVGDINFLNPNDIASVEILKDASASAIYGSRGANGVVLITTKKGKLNSKASVNLDVYYGVQKVINNWKTTTGPEWYQIQEELNKTRTKPIDLSLVDKNQNTDWFNAITRVAPMQNYNFGVTGGSKAMTYALSIGHLNQEGTVEGSSFERTTGKLNVGYQVSKRFKIGTNLNIEHSKKYSISEENYHVGVINTAIKIEPVIPVWKDKANHVYDYSKFTDYPNPVAAIQYDNNHSEKLQLVGNIFGELELAKGLKAKTSFGQSSYRTDYYNFTPVYSVNINQQNLVNNVYRKYARGDYWSWENTLNYDAAFGKHSLSALAGYTMEEGNYEWFSASKNNIPNEDPSMWYLDAAADGDLATSKESSVSMMSFLGRINYSYENKYLATVNFRADASSKFPKENRWGYFPSVALGWKISKESFLENATWLTNLKLRAGWGQIGNQNIGSYPYQETMNGNSQYRYLFGMTPTIDQGYVVTGMVDQSIKWETVESLNFGVDASFFDDRLQTTIDWYNKKTKDMLVQVPIPYYYGYEDGPTSNVGSVKNNGLEVSVNYRDRISNKLSYNVGFNIATVKNEVLSLGNGKPIAGGTYYGGNATRTEEGEPIGYFYGYKTDGVFQSQQEIDKAPVQEGSSNEDLKPGDLKFVDVNGDGVVNDEDKTYLGSPIPKFTYGFNLGVTYGAFDLSAFVQGSQGNKIFNAMKTHLYNFDETNKSTDMLNSWTPTNTNTNMPRLNGNDKNNTNRTSDRFVEDGSYARLKNITLGYTLPKSLVQKAGIASLRFYVSGQNLVTITNYSGADPEIGQNATDKYLTRGVDIGTYPQAQTYVFGVKLGF
ncbi:SusC/RagA family TonB-linked outer membrane protein [Prolixibacter bellariivorans]|uniref:SusC/RagA family TonB-linked outer membrane protein n=1 Tax=Prolixibacter bellariivorans TaxID=314319 RepID=A0A5M4AZF5_9BACT|nr:TonB-dependent receptor [Prolixibacter bellariivorans]GET33174.1 SusC/RagA family TonB-linked outer membrane protein [Prolixibacter bellariivorans]